MTRKCSFCDKPALEYRNHCSDECFKAEWAAAGGPVICPNGLPVTCYRGKDGARMEHEHADHPDYKFPVHVDYVGEVVDNDRDCFRGFLEKHEPVTDDKVRMMMGEHHALIYTDGTMALTMYEHCYALWYLKDGSCEGGDLWIKHRDDWRLNEESRKAIIAFHQERSTKHGT